MKKKGKNQNNEKFKLSKETKRGLIIIVLSAFIILSVLSLFHLAGRFGFWLEDVLKKIFGVGYFAFPFLLMGNLYFLIMTRKKKLNFLHYGGFFLFILSFYGILHLTVSPEESRESLSLGKGGGYVGLILGYPAVYFFDFWGGFILLLAIFLGSFLLVFNVSLDVLLSGMKVLKLALENFFRGFRYLKNKIHNKIQEKKFSQEIFEEEQESEHADEEDLQAEPNFTETQISSSAEKPKESASEEKQNMIDLKPSHTPLSKIKLPISLLEENGGKPTSGDIENNIKIIKKTLENFGIEVEMGKVSVGPTVTQYTLKPAEGIKLSRIVTLSADLSLALAAHPIRIEAPIPGKALVGIEVPNKKAAKVRLKDIITSAEFKKRPSNLMIALGKDVSGKVWLTDLTKNPHLLIAGSTGSGKTICINNIILGLLYQNDFQDLKFILIDPKRVELPVYNGIPYLATPVITSVKKTISALRWAVEEMDRRFETLSETGSRDIFSYRSKGNSMPSIIIIIDELADLMAAAGPEIEALIIRLAQMSRAVGIYLILATQRPSVNVITGLIKANITSRVAFSVASLADSRTILDLSGAEKLLGRGDMLFISAEVTKPKRLQGAFVTEQEIKRVTDYLKERCEEVDYDEEITEKYAVSKKSQEDDLGEDEEFIQEAKEIVVKEGRASSSLLQRRMRVGYNRAARIIEILEKRGVVGPLEGSRPREVLVSAEELYEDEGINKQENELSNDDSEENFVEEKK